MMKAYDLRQREVIDIETAERLGYVSDVDVEFESGIIRAIVVPKAHGMLRLFTKDQDYVIPWEDIAVIGKQVILVKCPKTCPLPKGNPRASVSETEEVFV